jgi:hypothetical protein
VLLNPVVFLDSELAGFGFRATIGSERTANIHFSLELALFVAPNVALIPFVGFN